MMKMEVALAVLMSVANLIKKMFNLMKTEIKLRKRRKRRRKAKKVPRRHSMI